jgi:hypothetical protein
MAAEENSRCISPPSRTTEGLGAFVKWSNTKCAAGSYVCFGVVPAGFDHAVGIFQIQCKPGELPAVDVLPDQAGDGDEGTAMLEILHDIAPNAALGFATAASLFSTDADFAANIRALRFDAGCDILVDDILYFNESPFQDGLIARAVNDVTADGALYFSSAGNEGNVLDGTSGNYEADFVERACVASTEDTRCASSSPRGTS